MNAQGVSRASGARTCSGSRYGPTLRKIQRLRESSTDTGKSLWEAVLGHLEEGKLVTRAEVLNRFHRDDPDLVRGVLHDLSEGGLVLRVGSGAGTAYRAVTKDELLSLAGERDTDGTDELVWAIVYREGPISHDALVKLVRHAKRGSRGGSGSSPRRGPDPFNGRRWLCQDVSDGEVLRLRRLRGGLGSRRVRSFPGRREDRLREARLRGEVQKDIPTGGSTYSFDVWPGHPPRVGRPRFARNATRADVSAANAPVLIQRRAHAALGILPRHVLLRTERRPRTTLRRFE